MTTINLTLDEIIELTDLVDDALEDLHTAATLVGVDAPAIAEQITRLRTIKIKLAKAIEL